MKDQHTRLDCVNRVKKNKSELLRIVLTPEGTIEVDPTGKMNGRGAYLTPDEATLELAKKSRRLEKSLKIKIDDEVYKKIGRYLVD